MAWSRASGAASRPPGASARSAGRRPRSRGNGWLPSEVPHRARTPPISSRWRPSFPRRSCPSRSTTVRAGDVSGPGSPAPFESGERALLIDARGRRFLVRLQPGQTFHFHGGAVPHDLILGSEEGTLVHSTTGAGLVCLRPTLADFVLKMPRGAQVVYPKDMGAIVMEADIAPASSVL